MTVTLDYWERKRRLPRGAAVQVAAKHGVSPSWITKVLKQGKGARPIQRDLARRMGVPIEVAFGPPDPPPSSAKARPRNSGEVMATAP